MRRAAYAFAALLAAALITLAGCAGQTFSFLSVRMKGGEGSIYAAAIHEFTLNTQKISVTLTLYYSAESNDAADMYSVESARGELGMGERLEIEADCSGGGWFCARAEFYVDGQRQEIISDTVQYDNNGDRVQSLEFRV